MNEKQYEKYREIIAQKIKKNNKKVDLFFKVK